MTHKYVVSYFDPQYNKCFAYKEPRWKSPCVP